MLLRRPRSAGAVGSGVRAGLRRPHDGDWRSRGVCSGPSIRPSAGARRETLRWRLAPLPASLCKQRANPNAGANVKGSDVSKPAIVQDLRRRLYKREHKRTVARSRKSALPAAFSGIRSAANSVTRSPPSPAHSARSARQRNRKTFSTRRRGRPRRRPDGRWFVPHADYVRRLRPADR